jgi:hypothetical protein
MNSTGAELRHSLHVKLKNIQSGRLEGESAAIGDSLKLRNMPCGVQNRIHDYAVHTIQDHLAQVCVIEKTEMNSQERYVMVLE